MYHITFRFRDKYTRGFWTIRHCVTPSVDDCIEMYGLDDFDVEYEIISVEKVVD